MSNYVISYLPVLSLPLSPILCYCLLFKYLGVDTRDEFLPEYKGLSAKFKMAEMMGLIFLSFRFLSSFGRAAWAIKILVFKLIFTYLLTIFCCFKVMISFILPLQPILFFLQVDFAYLLRLYFTLIYHALRFYWYHLIWSFALRALVNASKLVI